MLTAGCLDPVSPSDSQTDLLHCRSLPADPPTLDPCPDAGFARNSQRFPEDGLEYGSIQNSEYDLALSISDPEIELGDGFEITMRNNADEPVEIGVYDKHDIQYYTADGWQNVRVHRADEIRPLPDVARIWEPGASHTWELEATELGLTDPMAGPFVCPDLSPGRYRFVFWGLAGSALGICFELA